MKKRPKGLKPAYAVGDRVEFDFNGADGFAPRKMRGTISRVNKLDQEPWFNYDIEHDVPMIYNETKTYLMMFHSPVRAGDNMRKISLLEQLAEAASEDLPKGPQIIQ